MKQFEESLKFRRDGQRRRRFSLSLKKSSRPPFSLLFFTSQTTADATLVDEGEKGFRVSTVGAPHVTGCATAHEPGAGGGAATTASGDGGGGGGGGARSSRASACSFALDVKGALRAVPRSSSPPSSSAKGREGGDLLYEIDGAFHVARIVSDAEFEGGIGPLNVEVALDAGKEGEEEKTRTKREKETGGGEGEGEGGKTAPSAPSSAEAAIESARGEIARRIVEAVSSVVKASESPRTGGGGGGGGEKEETKEKEQKEEVKVGGEAA